MQGVELIARNSMYNFSQRDSRISEAQIFLHRRMHHCDERTWANKYLQSQFRTKRLGEQYKKYEQRILVNNYTVYLYLQLLLSMTIFIFNLEECKVDETLCGNDPVVVSEMIGHLVIFMISLIILCFNIAQEKIRQRNHYKLKKNEDLGNTPSYMYQTRPWLPYLLAGISASIILISDAISLIVLTNEDIRVFNARKNSTSSRSYLTHLMFDSDILEDGMMTSAANYTSTTQPTIPPIQLKIQVAHRVPVLSLYNIIFVYFYFPIIRKGIALGAGVTLSTITIIISSVCHKVALDKTGNNEEFDTKQLLADIVYHIALNFIGWYSRYVGEINNRRGFLDKRDCIETTFKLKHEKDKEAKLINSIIPAFISSELKNDLRNYLKNLYSNDDRNHTQPFQMREFKRFENVSILYADICNFTPLTTTLEPYQLVQTLNDLFGKFDDAAETTKCMRIKILGDCYYSISGAPDRDERHAHHSVELGLEMIQLIKEVRREHNVNVNMRIGVHSGYILSGLIGLRKWQYDIWSNDVTIANHMESTGEAGAVHITESTKSLLGDEYGSTMSKVTRSLNDDIIKNYGKDTYLIKPKKYLLSMSEEEEDDVKSLEDKSPIDSDYDSIQSGQVNRDIKTDQDLFEKKTNLKSQRRVSIAPAATLGDRGNRRQSLFRNRRSASISSRSGSLWSEEHERKKRKSILMDSTIRSFHNIMQGIEKFMDDEIEELPIKVSDRWHLFSNWRHRHQTKKGEQDEGDERWKRRVSKDINPVFLVFNKADWNLEYLKEQDHLFKHYILASYVILVCMSLILTLTSFNTRPHVILWVLYTISYIFLSFLLPATWISYIWDQIIDPEFDLDRIVQPENKIINFFYQASGKLNTRSLYRNIIFFILSSLIIFSTIFDVLITPCSEDSPRNYTYRTALSIMTIFVFLRINNVFKTLVALVCMGCYLLIISGTIGDKHVKDFFAMETFGFDHWFESAGQWSHFLYIFLVSFMLCLSDRQKEYIHRLDYLWKRQLKKDQEEARQIKTVNKILLQNILPNHVANIYTKGEREQQRLYSEYHESVAVMFASIPDFMAYFTEDEIQEEGGKPLKVLNKIISNFDRLLYEPSFNRIEKIKIISSTLMVACGLQSNRRESNGYCPQSPGRNALTLVKFAAETMRTLDKTNLKEFNMAKEPDFRLRVGICEGPVIAGVVGAMKPLYDIWGDTVNVASRMDYTGEKGKIHLPEKTALAVQQLNVDCSCRGSIDVKGKGKMVTYWVQLDHKMEVKMQQQSVITEEDIEEISDSKPDEVDVQNQSSVDDETTSCVDDDQEISTVEEEIDQQDDGQGHIEHSLKYFQNQEGLNKSGTGILKTNRFTKKSVSDEYAENLKNSHGVRWVEQAHGVRWDEQAHGVRWVEQTKTLQIKENEDSDSAELKVVAQINREVITDEVVSKEEVNEESKEVLNYEDTEPEEFTEEELARLETKKDSGYGSQGILKVNKQTKIMGNGEELKKQNRVIPEKLGAEEILEHYDSYQDFHMEQIIDTVNKKE